MADISIRRSHNLGLEQVKTITQKVITSVQSEFPSLVSDIQWNSTQTEAKVKGKGFTGVFSFDATQVSINVDLSMLVRPFKGKVEEKINGRLDEYLKG